jgi:hypothetical protein
VARKPLILKVWRSNLLCNQRVAAGEPVLASLRHFNTRNPNKAVIRRVLQKWGAKPYWRF